MLLIYLPFGLRRNPVWRDSSNVKRERAVRDGYGIERMGSDSGILLGIILNFCHFLFVLKGLTTNYTNFTNYLYYNEIRISLEIGCRYGLALCPHAAA